MLVESSTWDLRVTEELIEFLLGRMRATNNRFYFRISPAQSNELLDLLSKAYELETVPQPLYNTKHLRATGHLLDFNWETGQITLMHRTDVRCVIHAFYHYVDHLAPAVYCSDCEAHGRNEHEKLGQPLTSLAAKFAEHFYNQMQDKAKERRMKEIGRPAPKVQRRKRGHKRSPKTK
jgi:hypothetical protein